MNKNFFRLFLLATIVLFSASAFGQTYSSERTIKITAPANLDLNSQFTVYMDLNTEITDLLTDNVDGNDLRVVYNSLELDRRVEVFQGSGARLWFRIPDGLTISAGASNVSFKIQYQTDINVSSPSNNDANVFQRFYDFNGASISPDFITGNATQNETLQIKDGDAWGDSYVFVNDLNFNRSWAAALDVDINVGTGGGHMTGFNNGSATTNVAMLNAFGGSDGDLYAVLVQEDSNTYIALDGTANQTYSFRIITKPLGAWFAVGYTDSHDFNKVHQSFVNNQLMLRVGTTLTPTDNRIIEMDDMKIYYDANFFGATIVFVDVNSITASFTAIPPSGNLDPESGINSIKVDFNSTSSYTGATISDYNWFVDGIQVSTDENYSRTFTATGDYNVSLILTGNDATTNYRSQKDLNYLVRTLAQGIDINFVWKATAPTLDVNYGVTSDTAINYAVWGFPNDQNQTGLVAKKHLREGDVRKVCVVVNTSGDTNSLYCETFYSTHVDAKVPINITTLDEATPFSMSANIVPAQSYSSASVDQNFWFFYDGSPDSNTYNITVDANTGYFISTYLVGLNAVDFNQTIQPYVVPVTDGINVIVTSIDSITTDIVGGVVLFFSRNISGAGNVLVNSGVVDSTGRISFPFVADIDHNYTIQYPYGTTIRTGPYSPKSGDSTTGITAIVPATTASVSQTITGVVDVNFLQSSVSPHPNGSVDLNQIVTTTRTISTIKLEIDHNGTNLLTDTNSTGVSSGGVFNNNLDVNGRSELYPLVVTFTITFSDGNVSIIAHSVSISRSDRLRQSLVNVQSDLGDVAGTMILSVLIIAIILGGIHWNYPQIDQSHTFVAAAAILGFLSLFGWVDGLTWIFATIAGGATYFIRRVDR